MLQLILHRASQWRSRISFHISPSTRVPYVYVPCDIPLINDGKSRLSDNPWMGQPTSAPTSAFGLHSCISPSTCVGVCRRLLVMTGSYRFVRLTRAIADPAASALSLFKSIFLWSGTCVGGRGQAVPGGWALSQGLRAPPRAGVLLHIQNSHNLNG